MDDDGRPVLQTGWHCQNLGQVLICVRFRQQFRLMTVSCTISAILQDKGAHVWAISPEATVFEAIQLMADKNIGALLVMSGERLLGMMTERDYTRKVALKGKNSKETPVREIVSGSSICVSPFH